MVFIVTTNLLSNLELWTIQYRYSSWLEKAFCTVPLEIERDCFIKSNSTASGRGYSFQLKIINGVLSGKHGVVSGFPQGSTLGSLLFIIARSDIANNTFCRTRMYAYETKIFCDPKIPHGDFVEDIGCFVWMLIRAKYSTLKTLTSITVS